MYFSFLKISTAPPRTSPIYPRECTILDNICCHLQVNDIQTMSNLVGYIEEEQRDAVEILRELKYTYKKTLHNQISIDCPIGQFKT